jgi:hypothetical protein
MERIQLGIDFGNMNMKTKTINFGIRSPEKIEFKNRR